MLDLGTHHQNQEVSGAWVVGLAVPVAYAMMLVMQVVSLALFRVEPNSSSSTGNTCIGPCNMWV